MSEHQQIKSLNQAKRWNLGHCQ